MEDSAFNYIYILKLLIALLVEEKKKSLKDARTLFL